MKLIVESGATKSNWIAIDNGQVLHSVQLPGINITSNPESIQHIDAYAANYSKAYDKIFYYGAGVSTDTVIREIKNGFKQHFNLASIYVESDILAAGRSISNGKTSIVSILGTGTNAVLFDGEKITKGVNSMGYLFNDYGSAFHLGQLFINAYFFDTMREEDKRLFESEFLRDRPEFKRTIYRSAKPNYEIAQCAKFLSRASKHLRKRLTKKAFNAFFENQINYLSESNEYKLNFVGSVGKVFEVQLRSVAEDHGYTVDQIVADPIDGLIKYHMQDGND